MPEAPEITFMAHELQILVGQTYRGHRVSKVESKGKIVLIHFEDGSALVFHFGLTGSLSTVKRRFIRKVLSFSKTKLYFVDPRRFGSVKFVRDPLLNIAPDVYEITWHQFKSRVPMKTKRPIGIVLLDQTKIVSGIGNYLRAEILHDARVSPFKTHLSVPEYLRIFRSMKKITKKALSNLLRGIPVKTKMYQNPKARKKTLGGRTMWY
jgi:formamidopyrimidine-DNA glycosylase